MSDITQLQERIGIIFETKLNLVVPSDNTDLFETGGLDSLIFVALLLELEREYDIKIDLADLDLGNFQSIANIAGFIAQRLEPGAVKDAPSKHSEPVCRFQAREG